jgi:hypothetical protein
LIDPQKTASKIDVDPAKANGLRGSQSATVNGFQHGPVSNGEELCFNPMIKSAAIATRDNFAKGRICLDGIYQARSVGLV